MNISRKECIKLIHDQNFKNYCEHLLGDSIITIFGYGSVVYNVKTNYDDFDLIIVTKSVTTQILKHQYKQFQLDFNVYSELEFKILLEEYDFGVIEAVFCPPEFYCGKTFTINIDPQKMRHAVSKQCSNSFVKAKKKFQEQDFYKGKKSLWHSLRILQSAIDLVEQNHIDFQCMNYLYESIVLNPSNIYEDFKQFKIDYNRLSSKFKKIAQK